MTTESITPEQAGRELARAPYVALACRNHFPERDLAELEKARADEGDAEGLAFWVSVHTQYLLYQTRFDLTGEFPDIQADDPVLYLAMMFWDDGWCTPECALWSAEAHRHPRAVAFFSAMEASYSEERHRIAEAERELAAAQPSEWLEAWLDRPNAWRWPD